MEIRQIIDKIDDHQLFVPAFQREYVWRRKDAKSLFSSLIQKYPTGTLLTWETTNPPELKGPVQYKPEMGAVKLILDGQQRVTTLYMLMTGEIPPYYRQEEILNDIRNLYVNIKTLELEYYKKTRMVNDPLWLSLTDIFLKNVKAIDIFQEIDEDKTLQSLVLDNFETIKGIENRNFPEQTIPVKATVRKAIDIFYIVNASGVNLTEAELALAQISGYWPKARELFKEKLKALKENGFVFKLDFIVYCLLAVLHNMGSDLRRLHDPENLEQLKVAWERLDKHVLDYTVNILRTHAYIDHTEEINTVFALIPIITFVYGKPDGHLSENEIKKSIKWFYYSQIWQRYITSTPQKLDKDLGIVRDNENPFDALISQIKLDRTSLEITPGDFVGRDVRHPLFSLMRWYFKSKGAVCLSTGVGLHQNMGEKYKLEKDHIFPYSALRDNGYDINNRFKYALAQELTNRAILTQTANRVKSATPAFDFLKQTQNQFPNALEKQCIPPGEELWHLDRYEDFLSERRQILANELNNFLNEITATKSDALEATWQDTITEGEHDRLEMKETLRWDIKQGGVNKELEVVILKTISALSNASGGSLLIGVADKLEPVGLERDYTTLQDNSKDGFELHLRGLINKEWGVSFTKTIKIEFPVVDGIEICAIHVKEGNKPLYLTVKNKDGLKQEKFYLRSGNSSPPIDSPKEIAEYVASRFPKLSE